MSPKALLLMGPPAVGKSVVCFEIFTQLVRAGIKSAYVDLTQLDFLRFSKTSLRESNQVGRISNEEMRQPNQAPELPGSLASDARSPTEPVGSAAPRLHPSPEPLGSLAPHPRPLPERPHSHPRPLAERADEIVWQPNHEVRAANLRAVWPGFRDAGAERLIVAGDVRDYSVPGLTLTVCRLRAGPEELTERILARGRGEGPPVPGDDLCGRDPHQLLAFARRAAAVADQLDRERPGDLCVDTDGRTVTDIAAEVLGRVSLHH